LDVLPAPPPQSAADLPSDRKDFLERIREAIIASQKKELVLFVHGYNVSFADAIKSAAQLTFDTAQDYSRQSSLSSSVSGPQELLLSQRVALAFDWASFGSLLRYGFIPGDSDLRRAKRSAKKLAVLLKDLSSYVSECRRIHIIAHSMGNLVLEEALTNRADSTSPMPLYAAEPLFNKVGSFTFAAPDLDRDGMVRLITESTSFYRERERE